MLLNNFRSITLACLSLFVMASFSPASLAHKHESHKAGTDDKVSVVELAPHIFMMSAGGGNIAVSMGDDGVFMVDNGLSENSEKVIDALDALSSEPVRFILNTHWHFDHVGNNDHYGEKGAIIIATDNVRERLQKGGTIAAFDKVIPPASDRALPIVTFNEGMILYLNGNKVNVRSLDPAHTDGDAIVFWEDENIIHLGDIFFNGFFPFIDQSSGGSLRGMLSASDRIASMMDDETKIIPGHGPLATKADFENYRSMLKILADRITTSRAQGMSKEDWVSKNPLQDLDEEWGDGFLDLANFTAIIWDAY